MHVEYVSQETYERRKRKVEDVKKRSDYRKAHGLDQEGVFGGWTAKSDEESLGPALREAGGDDSLIRDADARPGPSNTMELAKATVDNTEGTGQGDTFVDFEGRRQPMKKKWFGVW